MDLLHGHRVEDPYRWLEDPASAQTRAWVRGQNQAARAYLEALPSRAWFVEHLTAEAERPRAGTPTKAGGRYFQTRNDGRQQQDRLHTADSLDELLAGGEVLLDPSAFSVDGSSSLEGWSVSPRGTWLAYLVTEGGSDWTSVRLRRLDGGQRDEPMDTLGDVRYSTVAWLSDSSFVYIRYRRPRPDVTEPPGPQLMRHRVGTPQADDELVLEFPDDPRLGMSVEVSHDRRFLVVAIRRGTAPENRLWVYPLQTVGTATEIGRPVEVVDQARAMFAFIRADGPYLYVRTDLDAPMGRVVRLELPSTTTSVSPTEPAVADVVPQQRWALRQAVAAGDEIIAVHLVDALPVLTRYSLEGEELARVPLEGGAVAAVDARAGDDEVFIGTTSATSRLTGSRLHLGDGSVRRIDSTGSSPSAAEPVSRTRRRASSRDGTEVPYFLLHREDAPLDRPRPTLLYAKGGMGVPALDQYRPALGSWIAAGGVLVIANLRGGGEYGAAWHEAGRGRSRQNVFDDLVAVAEHLVAEGVTTRDRLALHGGSNGGLTVAAVMTQRPDLAAAVVPSMGVLDMLRFHRFTVGSAWIGEYGSPDDPDDFAVLRAYSPLHNLRPGTRYPATLVLAGAQDDRVVPAHSLKFTAAAQHAQAGHAPVLLRLEAAAGHGQGRPASAVVAEGADLLAFVAEHTGLRPGE